ncbi:MAG: imidazole glycerol phosphate synthase subunit HisH [Flavobacteriaceae bacterium]
MQNIAIIDYGAGNTQSVINALERLNVRVNVTKNLEAIRQADKVIFPGVGHAKAAMGNLKATGLDEVIPTLNQPVLGICLGMQLLCDFHTEGAINGLGIFDVDVKKFDTNLKVPQIGWNQIENLKSDLFKDINEKAFMYLVHSYYVPLNDASIAVTDYGIKYASALQKDNFYGVQFHPEKSGKVGARVLRNFLEL